MKIYTLISKEFELVEGKVSKIQESKQRFEDLLSAHRAMENAVCERRKILYYLKFKGVYSFLGKVESDIEDYRSTVNAKLVSNTSVMEVYYTFEIRSEEV